MPRRRRVSGRRGQGKVVASGKDASLPCLDAPCGDRNFNRGSVEYPVNVRRDRVPREGRPARGGLISARRRASVAAWTVVSVGVRSPRGPIGRPGGTDAHAERPRTWAGRKDTAAFLRGELVEPVNPWVWYIDPATPEEWVPYFEAGILEWNGAFEDAGFKNAIQVRRAPTPEEDPEFSLLDARWSVVRYVPTTVRSANSGGGVIDPRSGEVLRAHTKMDEAVAERRNASGHDSNTITSTERQGEGGGGRGPAPLSASLPSCADMPAD